MRVKIAVHATSAPRARLPVSPINILASFTLNSKKALSAPTDRKHNVSTLPQTSAANVSPTASSRTTCTDSNTASPTRKAIVVVVAKPSIPSVRFTPFVHATKMNTTNGITQNPMSD